MQTEDTETVIEGYRPLTQREIETINDAEALGNQLGAFIDKLARPGEGDMLPDIDPRWLATARTDLQKGMMSLVRAIAKPEGF